MRCPKCGHNLKKFVSPCPACGVKLKIKKTTQRPTDSKSIKKQTPSEKGELPANKKKSDKTQAKPSIDDRFAKQKNDTTRKKTPINKDKGTSKTVAPPPPTPAPEKPLETPSKAVIPTIPEKQESTTISERKEVSFLKKTPEEVKEPEKTKWYDYGKGSIALFLFLIIPPVGIFPLLMTKRLSFKLKLFPLLIVPLLWFIIFLPVADGYDDREAGIGREDTDRLKEEFSTEKIMLLDGLDLKDGRGNEINSPDIIKIVYTEIRRRLMRTGAYTDIFKGEMIFKTIPEIRGVKVQSLCETSTLFLSLQLLRSLRHNDVIQSAGAKEIFNARLCRKHHLGALSFIEPSTPVVVDRETAVKVTIGEPIKLYPEIFPENLKNASPDKYVRIGYDYFGYNRLQYKFYLEKECERCDMKIVSVTIPKNFSLNYRFWRENYWIDNNSLRNE